MPPKQPAVATLVAIRAAHHRETTPKYDRVVFEFSDFIPLMRIEYVEELIADGSGQQISVEGRAILSVQFTPAYAHDERGKATVPLRLRPRLTSVREIISAGDFEAVVTYGIGLARKAETRIVTLGNPYRVVIDFF